jgi:hypothetical protein
MRKAIIRLAERLGGFSDYAGRASAASAVPAKIDLSGSAAPELESPGTRASLPRALVNVDLVLPAGSQAGAYRVTIAAGRNMKQLFAADLASAIIRDSLVELRVTLDLRRLRRGNHYLGICRECDPDPHYYPIFLD